jgi:hypothetical protein
MCCGAGGMFVSSEKFIEAHSGKYDFYDPHPPLRNALDHNNHDGTFITVHATSSREHRLR